MALHSQNKGCSLKLSISYEARSLLQKFESSLKRLQIGIDKRLDGELVASKINEVQVKRENKIKTIISAFEIKEEVKTMILTFAIKLEQSRRG